MPDLDYALLCEHVRQDGGLAHIVAANIDTLMAESVPAAWNLGLLVAVRPGDDEVAGTETPIEIVLRNEAGERLVQIEAVARSGERPADLPVSWPTRGLMSFNIGVLVPAYGLYAFEIRFSGELRRKRDSLRRPVSTSHASGSPVTAQTAAWIRRGTRSRLQP